MNKRIFLIMLLLLSLCTPVFAATTSYVYDELDRLSETHYADGGWLEYKYDEIGNMIAKIYHGYYSITASAGTNGTVSPSSASVYYGGSQTFTMTPAATYHVAEVVVDGVSQGAVTSYTFSNIATPHTISASFAIDTFPITVNQGVGYISPASATINYGGNQTFTISPASRYMILDVKVDGASQGNISSYTFYNVTAPHTIEASFSLLPCTNKPVRISGAAPAYFNTIQDAYNAAASGATIQAQDQVFIEDFTANRDISVTIDGGYSCDYSANPDKSILQGALHLSGGTVNLKNFRLAGAGDYGTNAFDIIATADSNGSVSPASANVYSGGSQTFTMTPATGYHVADVVLDGVSQGDTNSYTISNVTAPHTLSATFAINSYTIIVDAGNNGSIVPSSFTVNYGGSQAFAITPTTGYHVSDVVVDGVSQGAVTSYVFSNVSAPHTISASFAINTYAITVNQGIGYISPASTTVNYGGSQTFTITSGSRYMILDVKVDGVSQGGISSYTFSSVTGPHTIEASFSLLPCPSNPPARISGTGSYFMTLQAAYDAAANGNTIQTQGQVFTENFVAGGDISVTIDGGYTCDYSANPDMSMLQGAPHLSSGTVTLKNFRIAADFGVNAFDIVATAGSNGTISPASGNVYPGGSQTFTMTPATGYHVADVVLDGVSQGAASSYTVSNVTAAHTISAAFAINTYTISASAGSNGSISPATSTINYGGSQTITMTPAAGYHVADVVVDGVSQGAVTSYTFTNIAANHTITVIFGMTAYTITASAGGNGTISPASATAYTGGSQTINITPATGYHVADVLVDGVSQGAVTSYAFTNIAADHTISASFAINTYAITVIQGIGAITPASATINHVGSQAFNISYTSRYLALDVKVDGVSQGNISSYTFNNVTGPHTIEAVFSMSPCSNPPARISGTDSYFSTLQAAYNAAANNAIIQTQEGQTFSEDFVANRDVSITMDGGYTCDYSANPDKTTLQGVPHLSSGTINLKNFRVMQ